MSCWITPEPFRSQISGTVLSSRASLLHLFSQLLCVLTDGLRKLRHWIQHQIVQNHLKHSFTHKETMTWRWSSRDTSSSSHLFSQQTKTNCSHPTCWPRSHTSLRFFSELLYLLFCCCVDRTTTTTTNNNNNSLVCLEFQIENVKLR